MSCVYSPAPDISALFITFQGRFFAATELKGMLAHVVINYDLKAEVEGVRPANKSFGLAISPDASAKLRFRKRTDL